MKGQAEESIEFGKSERTVPVEHRDDDCSDLVLFHSSKDTHDPRRPIAAQKRWLLRARSLDYGVSRSGL